MSPLGLFGSLVAGRLYSRRICGQAFGSARLLNQSRTLSSGVGGSGSHGRLPMAESHRSAAMVGAFSLFGGGVWYLKEDPEGPRSRELIHETVEEDTMEDKVMKKRFEEWMIKYDRTYKDKEEKAMRYKLFKKTAQRVDENNAKGNGCTFNTLQFSDRTDEELRCSC